MEEVFKATFDDSEIIKKLEDLEKQVLQIGKSVDSVGDIASQSLNQAAGAADNLSQSMDAAAQDTAKHAASVEKARAANQTWLQSIKQTIAGQQIGGKSLGEWAAQAQDFAGKISMGAKAVQGATVAQRIFNGVLKASGIGLLIGLVASVIAYFSKFQNGIDKVSQVISGLNAVVNVMIDRFLKVGAAILKVFSGDFEGAANDVAQAVTGIGTALVDAASAAYNLEKRLQALRDVTITQSVEAARARVELDKFRQIVDDGTQSIAARAKAARQGAEIERTLAEQAFDRALEAQQIAQQQFALDKESLAAKEEAAKKETELQEATADLNKVIFDAEKEQREFRKEAAEQRQKQLDEEKKKAEALQKEYEKLFADIQRQAEALNIENTFNPVERVIKQYQAAIDETEKLRQRLLVIAPGQAEKDKVEDAIGKLFDEIAVKYREELEKAEDELNALKGGKLREALNPLPPLKSLERDVSDVLVSLNKTADAFIKGQQPRSLAQILGISEDSLEGLKDAAGEIIGALSSIADARVKEAEAATQAADRKVQAAEDAYQKERELAAQGLANDSDLRKQQLEEAKKQREAALKEEAKARRSQILLDSVGQLSSLATASANIFKALSPIPFAGIPLAIATIGIMFGAFAKAKADALKAASVPKFRKGTKLEGRSHEAGGLAISDEHGNIVGEAEGDEWLIGTKPSREHDTFLTRLNDGEFEDVDLNRFFRPSASNPITEAAPRIARIEQQRREMEQGQHTAALESAYYRAAERIVTAIEEKEVVTPLTNYRVTKRRGRNTYTKIVKEEK